MKANLTDFFTSLLLAKQPKSCNKWLNTTRRKISKREKNKIFTIKTHILIYTVSHKVVVLQKKTIILIVAPILKTSQLMMKMSMRRNLLSRWLTLYTITVEIRLTSIMTTICFLLHKSSIFQLETWHTKNLNTSQMKCFWT